MYYLIMHSFVLLRAALLWYYWYIIISFYHYICFIFSLYLFYIYLFYSNKNLEDHLQHQHLLFQESIQVESIHQEISRYIRLSRWWSRTFYCFSWDKNGIIYQDPLSISNQTADILPALAVGSQQVAASWSGHSVQPSPDSARACAVHIGDGSRFSSSHLALGHDTEPEECEVPSVMTSVSLPAADLHHHSSHLALGHDTRPGWNTTATTPQFVVKHFIQECEVPSVLTSVTLPTADPHHSSPAQGSILGWTSLCPPLWPVAIFTTIHQISAQFYLLLIFPICSAGRHIHISTYLPLFDYV